MLTLLPEEQLLKGATIHRRRWRRASREVDERRRKVDVEDNILTKDGRDKTLSNSIKIEEAQKQFVHSTQYQNR